MADDGNVSNNKPNVYKPQETFHRAQETQVEHKFPNRATGIVDLPPGSRGPKSLYLKRFGNSFGFTLRHFIVYPPDSVADNDGRLAALGLSEPMDTIFVKHVKEKSPAQLAGLQCGDRIVGVNRISVTKKSYAEVVKLIQFSPDYLHLLVVPKEDDILQTCFAETAYNPVSNQQHSQFPSDRQGAQEFLTQTLKQVSNNEVLADAISWRSLQNSYVNDNRYIDRGQRSFENLDVGPAGGVINEANWRQGKARAQPQVPFHNRKMGRRASDGYALSDRESFCYDYDFSGMSDCDENTMKMKAIYKPSYLTETQSSDMSSPVLRYPNSAGCRLSLDGGRRESASSLNSSLADGSKDSLYSFDSTSTLTGHETDDSAIMSRYRKSFQQKEEFLKMPSEGGTIQREFYSRPKKLEKAMWPPNESPALPVTRNNNNTNTATKPTHHNFQRVKNDIDTERDLLLQSQQLTGGGIPPANLQQQQKGAKSPKERIFIGNLDRIHEASPAPTDFNGAYYYDDEHYPMQMVHTRARQFESGKPLPEDDPMSNRTNFYRSELARISSKRVVPNVTERAQEFETRSSGSESKRDTSPQKRVQRDARSLDSSGSNNNSSSSINELTNSKKLSGNVIISSGSKYIHCPPPSENGKPTDTSENQALSMRARSNSAESWIAALPEKKKPERISRQDATDEDGPKTRDHQQAMDISGEIPYGDLPPLIPEPVEHMHFTPSVSITPAPTILVPPTTTPAKAVRPNQLDLEGPVRPSRHLKPPTTIVDTPICRPVSPVIGEDNKPVVVKRRAKNTNLLADDERAMRRESYLKATEGGRMHFEGDLSDGDVSPQVLRSAHRRWRPPMFPGDIQQLRKLFEDPTSSLGGSASGNSSSSASLDREKSNASPHENHKVHKEGQLHCKITEIDGKRFGDRSWKQIWAILKGPKLYLLKDKHHQSPMGTADAVEHSLANGVDMRASCVRVAEDYTKRKNVLRVSGVNPCRSEFLLQAENPEELAEWVKALQEKVATTTDVEAKFDPFNYNKQQAVPQQVPASTSIQVQGSSRLSPQPNKSKSSTSSRNRSPTGQSPISKTRKSSSVPDPTSPKSKTWRGRVVKQFRKMHGASSPSSPTAPEGSTFGVPLDQCLPSEKNPFVPKIVEVCTEIIDSKGIQTVGIYRVPGNNASIMALSEEVNKNYDAVPVDDPKWNDLHVVSSLLKSYVRKIPDSLVTNVYPEFIKADKIDQPELRMKELRRLVKSLPRHNYHTLKHIILHLRKISDNSTVNKMDLKNLAIVFGPNIVRPDEDNMQTLVNNMNHQCKIIETFLSHADWFFSENDEETDIVIPITSNFCEDLDSVNNHTLLLDNLSKVEASKEGTLIASLINAAQRKVKRKPKPQMESREEVRTPTSPLSPNMFSNDLKDSTDGSRSVIPTTVRDIEKHHNQPEKVPWFNYSTDQEDFHRRIENFERETNAMLKMPRQCEISVNNIALKPTGNLSSSANNVNQANSLPTKAVDSHLLKTHSASNVFSRTINADNSRNSLNSIDNNSYSMQYANNSNNSDNHKSDFSDYNNKSYSQRGDNNRNIQSDNNYQMANKSAFNDLNSSGDRRNGRFVMRRGSSVENISTSSMDLNANGTKKKIKYENEGDLTQRVSSLDSINKIDDCDDEPDLVAAMTKLLDKKLKEGKGHSTQGNLLDGDDLPYVDESPEKHSKDSVSYIDKENVPESYRNPSLHKNNYTAKLYKWDETKFKESKKDIEKDEDSSEKVPDNERHISNKLTLTTSNNTNKKNNLKRSESLTKTERTSAGSPLNNIKLKRSESLNKPGGDKLKRSDSLTKNEKTESNLNKRRELSTSTRRNKDVIKLKRKNGMPDRSIKRRHTVGGTKDPDKVTWLDNKNQDEITSNKENNKDLRTSSPDLSSTRRERLLFEINLTGPENMVIALKQHLMGARPQSFPDTAVFKVPLESHV